MKFRKKPVVIEAVQWKGDNAEEILKFTNANEEKSMAFPSYIMIRTLEGDMNANKGDWIIKGVKGEFYQCKPDIFEETYEKVLD